jgi:hypothetical protein
MQKGSTFNYLAYRWIEIKYKIQLGSSLKEEQTREIWYILEELQDIFTWHKGELGHCTIGEHVIDTRRLPPCLMTLGRLSY